MFQLNLFKRKTAEKALELASWLRIEIGDLRNELNLNKLEEMLTELKQRELFEDEEVKGKRIG
jgi:hypothetical protein